MRVGNHRLNLRVVLDPFKEQRVQKKARPWHTQAPGGERVNSSDGSGGDRRRTPCLFRDLYEQRRTAVRHHGNRIAS